MADGYMIGEIRNTRGERIDCTFTAGAEGCRHLAVVAHGVTSHKERVPLIAVCDALAAVGIASLRISFTGNGDSEGRFADCTITKEVADLGAVIDALDGWRVAYVGHSMGGAVGVLRAAHDRRIAALVSMAGMVHVTAFMERVFGHLGPGDLMLDKPECPLSAEFLADARRHHSVLAAGRDVRCPWLLVHGTADDLVPLQDSVDVREATAAELIELPGVDHRFTGHESEMAQVIAAWLGERFATEVH